MSKHNYSKYSSNKRDAVIEEVEASVSGMPVLEMPIVEPETPVIETVDAIVLPEEPLWFSQRLSMVRLPIAQSSMFEQSPAPTQLLYVC